MVEGNPGRDEAEDQIGDTCWASTLAWRQADCKPVGNDGDGQDMETQKVQQRDFFSSPICSPKKKEGDKACEDEEKSERNRSSSSQSSTICSPKKKEGDKACKDEKKPERSREGSEPARPHWDRLTSVLIIMIGF